jgi:hypothetical protein
VIYITSKVAGSVGPFALEAPDQCEAMKRSMINQCVDKPGSTYKCSEYELRCVPLPNRPQPDPSFIQ